jgi:hypothetical protein
MSRPNTWMYGIHARSTATGRKGVPVSVLEICLAHSSTQVAVTAGGGNPGELGGSSSTNATPSTLGD